MIAQIGTTLFVTPDAGCELCEETSAVWLERDVNAADECPCITRQLDEHENPFSHYEVIAENASADSRKLYAALKQLEAANEKIEQSEENYRRAIDHQF